MDDSPDTATVLTPQIAEARASVAAVAQAMKAYSDTSGWSDRKPIFELILYLNQIDFDIKVLLDRLLRDPDNRSVWLKYLALVLHETLDTLPKVASGTVRHYNALRTAKTPHPQVIALEQARNAYGRRVRRVKNSGGKMLESVRNTLAAHPRDRKTGMTPLVEWVVEHEENIGNSLSDEHAAFIDYALEIGLAVQAFGHDIQTIVAPH